MARTRKTDAELARDAFTSPADVPRAGARWKRSAPAALRDLLDAQATPPAPVVRVPPARPGSPAPLPLEP